MRLKEGDYTVNDWGGRGLSVRHTPTGAGFSTQGDAADLFWAEWRVSVLSLEEFLEVFGYNDLLTLPGD